LREPILITGASGFIGRHLTRRLLAEGLEVHALTRELAVDKPSGTERARWTVANLCQFDDVTGAIARIAPRTVFHLAASTAGRSRTDSVALTEAIDVNLRGTLNLFSALAQSTTAVERVVRTSGLEEYGLGPAPFCETQREQPISAYSASQVATTHFSEMLFLSTAFPITTLRLALVYGPEQSTAFFVPALIEACLNNRSFPMTAGTQTRDYLYVQDAVEALILAARSRNVDGAVINIGSGAEVSMLDIATRICTQLDRKHILRAGAVPDRQPEIRHLVCNPNAALDTLAWRARTSLDDGLRLTIDHYKSQRRE
jgi:UDP-glucose 4-epimerase